jgi:hypothetical protein
MKWLGQQHFIEGKRRRHTMFEHKLTPTGLGVLLCGGLLVPSLPARSVEATATVPQAQTEDLHPFTHLAYIPANSELGTLRFERIKRVNVPTRIKRTTDANYCAQAAFRDPGESVLCPSTRTESVASAYEVTYSYTGQAMASDEFGSRDFTLKVYFQPDELAPEVRQAASARKPNRTDAAEYFAVNTYREPVRRVVIDSARSSFCPGAYEDGVWIHSDKSCQDDIHYTMITAPSDSVTVRVDAVPLSAKRAALTAANTKRLEESRSSP